MASLEELILFNLSSMTEVPRGIEFLLPLLYLAFGEITNDFLTLLRQSYAVRGQRYQYFVLRLICHTRAGRRPEESCFIIGRHADSDSMK
ncbi:hypothetical protein ZWY2020_047829 [Hordeum vulgare]|nr:hypothetical protein ZWY2020_047829 [Hordeum vulgare]